MKARGGSERAYSGLTLTYSFSSRIVEGSQSVRGAGFAVQNITLPADNGSPSESERFVCLLAAST